MKSMDKLRKTYEEISSAKKRSFLQFFANLSDCYRDEFGLRWDALITFEDFENMSAGTMAQLEKQFAASKNFWTDGSFIRKWLFSVKALSAVCPRLSGLHWRLSADVRGMACFFSILLSVDARGWILNIKSHQYGDLVVRGCPRPPGSPCSCGKTVVRGRFGFLLGLIFFWCVNRLQHVHFPLRFSVVY